MISFAIGVAVSLLVLQASISVPREAFMSCMKQAGTQAASQKVSPTQFKAHVMQSCSAQAETFVKAMISFDVKNGIKRAQAASDAQMMLDDFIASSADNYQAKVSQ